ncbi:hypothetical protein [Streptomyces sp. NPDC052107]|uniref:hypothetical protein n=1 Tax=Streptomyces sp. NPDC052107 TaxID=3155632 RepID=UPI00342DD947
MSTVHIGVISAGNVSADHVNTLHRWVSGAEVVRVADVDEERAASAAALGRPRHTPDLHRTPHGPRRPALRGRRNRPLHHHGPA